MKFYLFAQEPLTVTDLPAQKADALLAAKAKARTTLDVLKALMEADAQKRAEA